MEARGEIKTSGVTVVTSDAPSDYHVAPRTENPNFTSGSAPPGAPPVSEAAGSGIPHKRKRGRPRKYGPDATIPRKAPPSPKPISSSVPAAPPPVIDFSTGKAGRIRGVGSGVKFQAPANNSEWVPCSVGGSFAPHMITVNAGEDVTMKVISFSQQGPRAVCILSAIGVISSVTLRHPDSSGGTLTYEGRFEILSLAGSFMASEDGGIKNRSGGMSISLVSPDGKVVGGCVAGLLVAASPVQIVVGSFLAVNQKPCKLIQEVCISSSHDQDAYPNQKPRNIIQTDINVTLSG